jgi:hypothetical protein
MALERLIDATEDHVIILDLGPAGEVDFALKASARASSRSNAAPS